MHFYQWNIGDYAKKTQHLTNEEDLAYRRLLDMYYDTENPVLTSGLAALSRRLRVSEEALKNVLDEFFPGGKNKHADEKIAEYYEYIDRQKTNGSKGGRPKHKPTDNPVVSQNNPVVSQNNPVPSQLEPITNNQEPETRNQNLQPEALESKPTKVKSLPSAKPPGPNGTDTELQANCKSVWQEYSLAYEQRYGTTPVRNAKINSAVKAFCQRIPACEAPQVAAWWVGHNGHRYGAGGHVFGLLLQDAEKIRTEWATNTKITNGQARIADRTEGMGQVWKKLIAEADERENCGSQQKVN